MVDWVPWDLLQQYVQELETFGKVAFIRMKPEKMFEFQDFCLKWHEHTKTADKSKQVIFIMKEVDAFKSLFHIMKQLSSGIL